jgi:hypothetical protein
MPRQAIASGPLQRGPQDSRSARMTRIFDIGDRARLRERFFGAARTAQACG